MYRFSFPPPCVCVLSVEAFVYHFQLHTIYSHSTYVIRTTLSMISLLVFDAQEFHSSEKIIFETSIPLTHIQSYFNSIENRIRLPTVSRLRWHSALTTITMQSKINPNSMCSLKLPYCLWLTWHAMAWIVLVLPIYLKISFRTIFGRCTIVTCRKCYNRSSNNRENHIIIYSYKLHMICHIFNCHAGFFFSHSG